MALREVRWPALFSARKYTVAAPALCLTAPRAREDAGATGVRAVIVPSFFRLRENRTAYRFRDKSVLRSLTRASDQSPIATAVRAVFTDVPPGKYADT